jgi:hypothetical protein
LGGAEGGAATGAAGAAEDPEEAWEEVWESMASAKDFFFLVPVFFLSLFSPFSFVDFFFFAGPSPAIVVSIAVANVVASSGFWKFKPNVWSSVIVFH